MNKYWNSLSERKRKTQRLRYEVTALLKKADKIRLYSEYLYGLEMNKVDRKCKLLAGLLDFHGDCVT